MGTISTYWRGKDGRFYAKVPDGEGSTRLVSRQNEEDLTEYLEGFNQNPTVGVVFYWYLERKEKLNGTSAGTIERNIVEFNQFFSPIRQMPVSELTEWDWIDFLEGLPEAHRMTRKRFNECKGIVRGMLKYCLRRSLVDIDISKMFDKIEVGRKAFHDPRKRDEDDVYPEEDAERLIRYLENHKDGHALAVALMYYGGLRLGECCALERSDFHDGCVSVNKSETRVRAGMGFYTYRIMPKTKTKAGMRDVVLPESASWVVQSILNRDNMGEYAFVDEEGERLNGQQIRLYLSRVCRKIGIKYRSPHKLRKTYASILLDNGADFKFIEKQMGHTSILTTREFYYRDRKSIEAKKEIMNQMDFVG